MDSESTVGERQRRPRDAHVKLPDQEESLC